MHIIHLRSYVEETGSNKYCIRCGKRKPRIYRFSDQPKTFRFEIELESDEEAIDLLSQAFPISVINLNPPKLGWVWKAINRERKVNYG